MNYKNNGESILYCINIFMPQLYRYILPIVHNFKWKNINFKENQVKVIMIIFHMGKTTSTEISKALNIPKGSLTTIIRSLVKNNIITKSYTSEDERKTYLTLTDDGKKFLEVKKKYDEKKLNELFSSLSRKDRDKIIEGFEVLESFLTRQGE